MKTRMTTAFIAAVGLTSIGTASLADINRNDDESKERAQSSEPLGGQAGMQGMGNMEPMRRMDDDGSMKDDDKDRMKMMKSMMRMHARMMQGMGGGMMQGMGGGMMQGMGGGDRMKDNQIRPMLQNAKADTGATLAEYDTSGDGMLDVDEYAQWYAAVMRQQIVDGFQHLDADGTGGVSVEELDAAVKRAASATPMRGMAQQPHRSDKSE